ncbi:MAG: GAF domain-containing protein [Chloroflexi bacterium]|nr:GAF domain-containing protein [Chloroflexota bacterium]
MMSKQKPIYKELKARLAEAKTLIKVLRNQQVDAEIRFRGLAQTANDAIITIGADQRIQFFNQAAERIFGYSAEEVMGQSIDVLIPKEYGDKHNHAIRRYLESGQSETVRKIMELKGLRKGGELFPLEISLSVARNRGETTFTAIVRDITKRKRAEEELCRLNTDLERRNRELFGLHEVGRKLSATLDVKEIYRVMHHEIGQKLLGSPHFTIAHFDEDSRTVICDFAITDGEETDPGQFPPMPLGEGPMSDTIRTREPRIVDMEAVAPPLEAKGRAVYIGDERRTKSAIYVPLISGNQVLGVMNVQHYDANAYKDADLTLLSTLASQASAAIQNARLFAQLEAQLAETKRAEEALKRKLDELSVLHAAATAGVEAADEDELIERITQIIGETLYSDNVGVLLLDEPAGVLHVHPSYRGVTEKNKKLTIPTGGQSIAGQVAATGRPRRIPDVAQEPAYLNANPETRSELCVPLKVGERVIGVINAESSRPDAFSEADERLLVTLAGQLATTIERLRTASAEREQRILAEALHDTAAVINSTLDFDEVLDRILENVGRVVPFEAANIMLVEEDTVRVARQRGYTALGLETWITNLQLQIREMPNFQRILESKQPYVVADTHADPEWVNLPETSWIRSYIAAPIRRNGDMIGVLNLDHAAPGFFTPAHAHRLQAFADQVAIALKNAQLFKRAQQEIAERKQAKEQIQRQLQRLAALHNIDMAITSSVDLRVTLNVLLNQVTTQLGVDAADVLLFNPHTQILKYGAGNGFRTTALQHTQLRVGQGHAGRAALERRILSIPNLAEETDDSTHGLLLASEDFVAYYAVPLIAKGKVVGVLEIFHRTPLEPDPEWLDFLESIATQAAIAIDNIDLFDNLQRSNLELVMAYDATLEGWGRALDLRDKETEGHTQRVTEMALRLAHAMNVNKAGLAHIRRGALLHDIGKMGVPDNILRKPGPLNDEEWEIMRQHPVYAYEMLSPITYLRPALDIPYCHHEKWDGTGYPRGLKGKETPLAARVFAVVDVWDALLSDRPYRKAWPEKKVLAYIREQAGKHFDPEVAEAFLELVAARKTGRLTRLTKKTRRG